MKAYIISLHGITTKIGRSDVLDFARAYARYLDRQTNRSPFENKTKTTVDFEQYNQPIVSYSLACGKRGEHRIFFGTKHGDRVYSPVTKKEYERCITDSKITTEEPSWIKNLMCL